MYMMINRNGLLCALVGLVLVTGAPQAKAQLDLFAVGPNVSTLGVGAEASVSLNKFLVVRVGGTYLGLSTDGTYGDINYDFDVTLATLGAALDVHPFGNGFLISAGLYGNGIGGELTSAPAANVTVGGQTFTGAQAGTLKTDVDYNPIAPFLGIGFDSAHHNRVPWSFNIRLGVLFLGEPDVTLTSTGTLAGTGAFDAELKAEERQLQDDLKGLQFFPVLTIGFKFRF